MLGEPFAFVLSASFSGRNAIKAKTRLPVYLILHHADPRLTAADPPPQSRLDVIYLGFPPNLLLPPSLHQHVEILPVRFADGLDVILPRIRSANCHMAVRPARADLSPELKPFTKGFTAAACGAPVIINRDADDALLLQGEDYPYFAETADPAGAIAAFERVVESFGSLDWLRARSRMMDVHSRIQPATLARALVEVTG